MKVTVRYAHRDGTLKEPKAVTWPLLIRSMPRMLERARTCETCIQCKPLCCDRGAVCRAMPGDGDRDSKSARLNHAIQVGGKCPKGKH